MTAIFVLRHPETTWNRAQRYQGRLQSPLSERGREQSRLAAGSFNNQDLEAVYSSPLRRALDLATEVANASGAPLRTDYRLTEIGQGVWEGLHVSEIRERYPDLRRKWYDRPDEVTFPYGENLLAVQNRALSAFDDFYRRHPDGMIAVVTHSVVVQAIVAAALCLELRYIHCLQVHNGGISTLCGSCAPGTLLCLNVTDALYGSCVASAAGQNCVSWDERKAS